MVAMPCLKIIYWYQTSISNGVAVDKESRHDAYKTFTNEGSQPLNGITLHYKRAS